MKGKRRVFNHFRVLRHLGTSLGQDGTTGTSVKPRDVDVYRKTLAKLGLPASNSKTFYVSSFDRYFSLIAICVGNWRRAGLSTEGVANTGRGCRDSADADRSSG